MRILINCHEYPPVGGGAAAACAAGAEHYVREGHSVQVLTMGFGDLAAEETICGVPVMRLPCGRRRNTMASPWEALVWARRCRRQTRILHRQAAFDISHNHFIMPAGIVGRDLKKRFGVPQVLTAHGTDVPGYNRERLKIAHVLARPWWNRICQSADRIICPSRSLADMMGRLTSPGRLAVIPYAFDTSRFPPLPKERIILLCSRLVARKGIQVFLEAIRDLELSSWEVHIVGDGPLMGRLRQLSRSCSASIHFHGWIDNRDPRLAELYGRAMVFAFPSEWENLPIALMEGMNAGCAVITTNVSGNPEVLGDCGLLVEPNDPAQLKQAVTELIGRPEHCYELGRRAAARVADCFSTPSAGGRHLELFRQIRGDAHPRTTGVQTIDLTAGEQHVERDSKTRPMHAVRREAQGR